MRRSNREAIGKAERSRANGSLGLEIVWNEEETDLDADRRLATITEKSYLNRLDELLAESRRLSEANSAKIRTKGTSSNEQHYSTFQ